MMPTWTLAAIAVVSALALVAALGMWLVAEQQNARLRRALRSGTPLGETK
jgi:hypothetical protein